MKVFRCASQGAHYWLVTLDEKKCGCLLHNKSHRYHFSAVGWTGIGIILQASLTSTSLLNSFQWLSIGLKTKSKRLNWAHWAALGGAPACPFLVLSFVSCFSLCLQHLSPPRSTWVTSTCALQHRYCLLQGDFSPPHAPTEPWACLLHSRDRFEILVFHELITPLAQGFVFQSSPRTKPRQTVHVKMPSTLVFSTELRHKTLSATFFCASG